MSEKISLWLPAIGIGLALIEWLLPWKFEHRDYFIMNWFANIVLLNATHVAYSFATFFMTPELGVFKKSLYKNQISWGFIFILIGIFLLILMTTLFDRLGYQSMFDQIGELWFLGALLPNWHALSHERGICGLYN